MRQIKTLLLLLTAVALVCSAQEELKSLPQGKTWTDEIRREFWFMDQGSKLMPYDWFLSLECPASPALKCPAGTPFREHLERYGFIPAPERSQPDNLPIGFTRHTDTDGAYIGLTCAACHTTRIDFPGQGAFLIEGGPGKLDFDKFFADVVSALHDTLNDPARKARFLAVVKDPDAEQKLRLRTDLLERRKRINTPDIEGGFGRLDAFGQIFNQIAVVALGNSEAVAVRPSAHASFPFLWDISQHEFVQWNGSAPNLGEQGTGSLLRNVGEVLGTFGDLNIKGGSQSGLVPKYPSSADTKSLKIIESWVSDLHSPQWPGPKASEAVRQAGEIVYRANCQSCHAIIDRLNRKYPIEVHMIPVDEVRTDRLHADNFRLRQASSGVLFHQKTHANARWAFATFGETAPVSALVVNASLGAYAAGESPGVWQVFSDGWRAFQLGNPDVNRYKARPLNGIWATAPYLHNGSIPNLAELLKRPQDRVTQFCVGSDAYDVQNVGYVSGTPCGERQFLFDTRFRGNSNLGHAYGTALTGTEKANLIEFLKTL